LGLHMLALYVIEFTKVFQIKASSEWGIGLLHVARKCVYSLQLADWSRWLAIEMNNIPVVD
jgi:hypothetical protein